MVCLYCKNDTRVINSRHQKRLNHIWRRRQCLSCAAVFTTSEIPEYLKSLSYVKGKSLEPFSRDKLFLGLYESLKHRKTAVVDASELSDTVVSSLLAQINDGALSHEQIVATTSQILKRFDKVAATHYDAFHPLN